MARLYTVGHSTREYHELVDVLETYGITLLADVRSFPRSRTNPQFDRERLADVLPSTGIDYEHVEALGGYRDDDAGSTNAAWDNDSFHSYADYALTDGFQAGLDALLDFATEATVAYMCAEKVYWRCHRRIISDWLVARDHDVIHVFDADRAEPHSLTRFAQVEDGTVTYPPEEA